MVQLRVIRLDPTTENGELNMVKKTVVKSRSRSAAASTTLVKLHLPTSIRNRLRMHAIEQGVKIVEVVAAILDENLPAYNKGDRK